MFPCFSLESAASRSHVDACDPFRVSFVSAGGRSSLTLPQVAVCLPSSVVGRMRTLSVGPGAHVRNPPPCTGGSVLPHHSLACRQWHGSDGCPFPGSSAIRKCAAFNFVILL